MSSLKLNAIVQGLMQIPTDINEHLSALAAYGSKSKHVVEIGTRTCQSAFAFASGGPKALTCVDIVRYPQVDELERLCEECGIEFTFLLGDSHAVDIPPCDFLFIDSYHTGAQLRGELERHLGKVTGYVGFHDTETFGFVSEYPYPGIPLERMDKKVRGLMPVIDEYIRLGRLELVSRVPYNNGLTICKTP